MCKFILNNIGLIFNLIGTILIAFSFGPYPDKKSAPNTADGNGDKKYIAYFNYPSLFYLGLLSLFIGFILQIRL